MPAHTYGNVMKCAKSGNNIKVKICRFHVAGYTCSLGTSGIYNVGAFRYDSSGNELWNSVSGNSSCDCGYGAALTSSNG